MDQSPNLTVSFHIRMFSAMTILGLIDAAMITFAVNHILKRGTSMMVIFAFEVRIDRLISKASVGGGGLNIYRYFHFQYTLLFTVLLATFLKYILHTIDLRSPDPWEDKSMYIFYLDLVVGKKLLKTGFKFSYLTPTTTQ